MKTTDFVGEWTAVIALFRPVATQSALQYCRTFTHSYTDGGVNHARQQPAQQDRLERRSLVGSVARQPPCTSPCNEDNVYKNNLDTLYEKTTTLLTYPPIHSRSVWTLYNMSCSVDAVGVLLPIPVAVQVTEGLPVGELHLGGVVHGRTHKLKHRLPHVYGKKRNTTQATMRIFYIYAHHT